MQTENPLLDCDSIILDESNRFKIKSTFWPNVLTEWEDIPHCNERRKSIILRAGDELIFNDAIKIDNGYSLMLRYSAALPSISADGLICEIFFSLNGLKLCTLLSIPISGGGQNGDWRVVEMDLSWLAGNTIHVGLRCLPGPQNDSSADWLAISQLCITRKDQIELMLARTFVDLRIKNEVEHFSTVYKHEMYAIDQMRLTKKAKDGGEIDRKVRKVVQSNETNFNAHSPVEVMPVLEPLLSEPPYNYACRLLAKCINQPAPNFVERILSRAGAGPVRILSLCSGAARIEAEFSAQVGELAEWTLLDINSDLLRTAAQQFSRSVKVDLIEANVNELFDLDERWDIILCVSALHHVVELEKLFKFCHLSLNKGGEFWSIGENIGKNGNRLWPDALNVANSFFSDLPERYRLNRHTGNVDLEIPDSDYSVGCFEGIRSQEIEPVMDIWFQQDHIYRINCFLWRVMNLAYSDNYDLTNLEDRKWISRAVQAEYSFFRSGGRGTELHGVYRPRAIL